MAESIKKNIKSTCFIIIIKGKKKYVLYVFRTQEPKIIKRVRSPLDYSAYTYTTNAKMCIQSDVFKKHVFFTMPSVSIHCMSPLVFLTQYLATCVQTVCCQPSVVCERNSPSTVGI